MSGTQTTRDRHRDLRSWQKGFCYESWRVFMITFSYRPHCSGHVAARFHRAFNCIQITFFLLLLNGLPSIMKERAWTNSGCSKYPSASRLSHSTSRCKNSRSPNIFLSHLREHVRQPEGHDTFFRPIVFPEEAWPKSPKIRRRKAAVPETFVSWGVCLRLFLPGRGAFVIARPRGGAESF